MKLIAILRDPVARAFSNFIHARRAGREPLRDFQAAIAVEDERMRQGWNQIFGYRGRGMYFQQLSRYLEIFDRSQLCILLFDDLKRDPQGLAAIASIGFGRDVAALDANGRRVFARVLNLTEFADSPAGERALWDLAAAHLPLGSAGDYNQALMDLGAAVCLPRKPLCGLCPLSGLCESRALGVQEQRPILRSRPAIPTRVHAAAVIVNDGKVLLARRPSAGLLGGMWEFPNAAVSADPAAGLAPALEAAYGLKVRPGPAIDVVRHVYTHFMLVEHVFSSELEPTFIPSICAWVPVGALGEYPMGKVDRQISAALRDEWSH